MARWLVTTGTVGGEQRELRLCTYHANRWPQVISRIDIAAELRRMRAPKVETNDRVLVVRDGERGEVLAHIEVIDGGFVCKVDPRHLGPDAFGAVNRVLMQLLLFDLDIEQAAK